jgi:hypothetical protein
MKREGKPVVTETAPPPRTSTSIGSETSHGWRRLPAIVKIILTVPLVMALLGAEVELRLAPQLDVILTAAGVWVTWAWLGDRSTTEV